MKINSWMSDLIQMFGVDVSINSCLNLSKAIPNCAISYAYDICDLLNDINNKMHYLKIRSLIYFVSETDYNKSLNRLWHMRILISAHVLYVLKE